MTYFRGMFGLGDNLYQRAVVRELKGEHHLATAWPQLYADLQHIRCVKPNTPLRTQHKNVIREDLAALWSPAPTGVQTSANYVGHAGTMLEGLCKSFGVNPTTVVFNAPRFASPGGAPYIVVRPATIRAEWPAESRNPRPEYLVRAVDALRADYRIVSVGDLMPGHEWAVEPLPHADETLHAGELQLEQLLGLVAGAAAVVGGVGWLVPAAVAYRVPMLLLFGGWGLHNGPARIFDSRMDTSRVHRALPDRFCMCGHRAHACDKTISSLDRHIERFAISLGATP